MGLRGVIMNSIRGPPPAASQLQPREREGERINCKMLPSVRVCVRAVTRKGRIDSNANLSEEVVRIEASPIKCADRESAGNRHFLSVCRV